MGIRRYIFELLCSLLLLLTSNSKQHRIFHCFCRHYSKHGQSTLADVPSAAKFTEKELPDQTGKVFIVTGASSGVGKELAQILYSHNAKVYVAARSSEKASKAIESIKTSTIYPQSKHLQKSFCPKRRSSTCYGIMQV